MNYDVTTRRAFLTKGLTLLAATQTVPTFLSQTVMAMARPWDQKLVQDPTGKDGKILVVVQLSGGNDGLNTVIPFGDDAYYRARGGLAVAADQTHKLNAGIGLHPSFEPLKALYDEGLMSVVQGVGYPNPNRSHFSSMDIWHTADTTESQRRTGWLGRYFDSECAGIDPKTNQPTGTVDGLAGIAMGDQLPLAMQGEVARPISFDDLSRYQYQGPAEGTHEALNQPFAGLQVDENEHAAQLDFLTRTAMDAHVSSDRIQEVLARHNPPAAYPNGGFGNGLRTVAAMIRGEMPTRVYYVTLGGFDTHANQGGRHAFLLRQLAQGVSAFWADMKDQKNEQRVLMMTFSEFGRRVAVNASGGTDHGAAAPMFFFGPACKQGLVGRYPSLTNLDNGDLRHTMDFRQPMASVLADWLDADPAKVLGPQYRPIPIFKS